MLSTGVSLFLVGLLLGVLSLPTHAQSRRGDTFYGKLGGGISDYTGDFPAGTTTHPLDFQEFREGSGLPFMVAGEFGYQFSPAWALALGMQAGNYPIAGYAGIGGISDSYRFAPQLLGRYTFGRPGQAVAPYIDIGINATFGGDSPPTSMGYGPTVGAGFDILLSREASFYVESRFNATIPDDAVDGAATGERFDMTGQLLGFGLKISFTTPTPPRIIQLDGPATAKAGASVTFAATINESDADRPLDVTWDFGDGGTASGLTATHAFERPGTHTVSFSASNTAGNASQSTTVTVERPPEPPRIASVRTTPDSITVGTPVQFSSAATGSGSLTYNWNFGDGASATGSSPTHTYNSPGKYSARLRVSNEAGSEFRTAIVRVAPRREKNRADAKQADEKRANETERDQQPARQKQKEQWGIVVASTREPGTAEAVGRQYQELFSDFTHVETVPSETDRGRRYRVVIGEYDDADAARDVLNERRTALPSGAWLLSKTVETKTTEQDEANPEQTAEQQESRAQGQRWGIVVSSTRDADGAKATARQYRNLFSESVPVETVSSETDRGRRYRVVIGEYEDADAARQVLTGRSEDLPSGAWLLRLK